MRGDRRRRSRFSLPFVENFPWKNKRLVESRDGRTGLALQHLCNVGAGPALIDLYTSRSRRLAVDLSLRLNVLAVCVAVAFVGAVLLGAF